VALSLAAALGAVAPTVLVDADLAGPSVAPRLDLNPRRNLFQVAYVQPTTPAAWDEQLARALQPLGRTSPHGQALCGLATSAMRSQVSPGFFTDLLDVLRARYRYVVLDLGADLLGTDAALHRTALHLADQVLLVTTPDIVDLLRVQAALGALATLGCDERRIALIANQYDRRRHPRRTELEWGLDRAVAALVPYDHAGLARAQAACQPVVLATRSRAGRALLDLAGRVYGGRLELPAERPRQGRWRLPLRLRWGNARLALRPRSAPLTLAEPAGEAGGSGDGH
jgi:Flp pilus assembly CpaE family ATPase